jgi:anaerobic selenocysteine-containing dehydrogenase
MRRQGCGRRCSTGPRGSGEFKEISWDEALALASEWLGEVRKTDPKKLAFFTGRDQSQSLTGFWAQQFGTPNYAAHGGFCSVNMAAAGIMTIGGAFWEFGAPDWERTKLFILFGVAEDHDSNPLKIGISKLKQRGARFVSVNPVRTGYSAIADNWLGVRPGTDGLLILSIVHELLKARKIDVDYLARYSNAAWLVIDAPGTAEHGLFARFRWQAACLRNSDGTSGFARISGSTGRTVRSDPTRRRALGNAGLSSAGREISR